METGALGQPGMRGHTQPQLEEHPLDGDAGHKWSGPCLLLWLSRILRAPAPSFHCHFPPHPTPARLCQYAQGETTPVLQPRAWLLEGMGEPLQCHRSCTSTWQQFKAMSHFGGGLIYSIGGMGPRHGRCTGQQKDFSACQSQTSPLQASPTREAASVLGAWPAELHWQGLSMLLATTALLAQPAVQTKPEV